jgi:hypothetical protein
MKTKITALACAALAACSSSKSETAGDASSSGSETVEKTVVRSFESSPALATLARFPSLAAHLGRGGILAEESDGFRLSRRVPRTVLAGGARLATTLPLRANGAVRVAREDRQGVFVEIASDVAPAPGAAFEGAVVYPSAGVETDVVQIAEATRVEELRVLHGPRAGGSFAWTLHAGPAITELRLREGRVEALEGEDVRIVSEPIVAIDSKGIRRDAKVALAKVAGGYRLTAEIALEGLAFPIALDPGWTLVFGRLSQVHEAFQALLLGDGRVVAFPGAVATTKVDIYDPITDQFSLAPPVTVARWSAAAIRLGSGNKVLMVGGSYSPYHLTYEIWDPVSGSSAAKSLPFGMTTPVLTTLPSGKIFATSNGTQAAIYNPAGDAWTLTADNPRSHGGPSIVTLPSGKVLVTGGCCSQSIADVYDPTTDTWTPIPNMNGARTGHKMFKLPSGKILLVGNDTGTGRGEIYDEVANTWTKITDMPLDPGAFGAAKLADGRVLVTNASGTWKQTMIYEEGKGWTTGTPLSTRRDGTVVVALPDGRALAVAGTGGTVGTEDSRLFAELWSPNAKTCTAPGDCTSGFCVDGYCCDRACGEQCNACDAPGREGYCMPLTGSPPHGSRTACSPYLNCYDGKCTSGCTSVADCSAGNACIFGTCAVKLAAGTSCFDGTDCSTGNCVDGVCCDTTCTGQCKACDVKGSLGTCTDVTDAPHGTRTSCAPYVCGGGACRTGCSADTQCSTGNYCDGTGKCVPALNNGKACIAGTQCTSGFCVDGYCCGTACTGACQTCSKTPGTCQNVTAGTVDPRGICVGECVTGCGASGCAYQPTTTVCGVSCVGNTLTNGGRCAGTSEACSGTSSAPCAGGLYCADGKTCKTSCTTGADCVSGICDTTSGTCGAAPPDAGTDAGTDVGADATVDGGADAPADTFADDTLVSDTFVPDTSVAETAEADSALDTRAIAETAAPQPDPKSSLPVSVQTCAKDADCPSGFCVEGVCCDSRCDQACHSCALLTSPGKCTEEPIGVDLKQDCGPAFTCLGTCGAGGECIGAGKGSMCARNRCTGPSAGVGPAYCSAPGARCDESDVVPFDCSPYVCAPAFGACLTGCASSLDCADTFVCDVASKTCIAPAPAEDSGGCAINTPGRARALPILALVLAAIGARRRRSEAGARVRD